jgi:hypothetical protein
MDQQLPLDPQTMDRIRPPPPGPGSDAPRDNGHTDRRLCPRSSPQTGHRSSRTRRTLGSRSHPPVAPLWEDLPVLARGRGRLLWEVAGGSGARRARLGNAPRAAGARGRLTAQPEESTLRSARDRTPWDLRRQNPWWARLRRRPLETAGWSPKSDTPRPKIGTPRGLIASP